MKDNQETIRRPVIFWQLPLVVGLVLLIVGFGTLIIPLRLFDSFATLFGISFFFIGLFEIIFSISNRKALLNWFWSLTLAVVTLIAGEVLISKSSISFEVLTLCVGFILLFRSTSAIGLSLDLRKYEASHWRLLVVIGTIGLVSSYVLVRNLFYANTDAVFWTGISFICMGTFYIVFSIMLKNLLRNWIKKIW
jgi:uncharacterized membrane protein HdeD (DUF308 family)